MIASTDIGKKSTSVAGEENRRTTETKITTNRSNRDFQQLVSWERQRRMYTLDNKKARHSQKMALVNAISSSVTPYSFEDFGRV